MIVTNNAVAIKRCLSIILSFSLFIAIFMIATGPRPVLIQKSTLSGVDTLGSKESNLARTIDTRILERARALTSESVQSHALAMVAETQERGEEKLLALNKQMSVLMSERAQEMSRRADEAWADVDAAKQRLISLRKLIGGLKRQAEIKRVEAGERETVAKKLFEQAKELGVEAKALQREKFITEYGAADGPPAVSPQALKLLRGEAFRIAELMRKDAAALRSARAARLSAA